MDNFSRFVLSKIRSRGELPGQFVFSCGKWDVIHQQFYTDIGYPPRSNIAREMLRAVSRIEYHIRVLLHAKKIGLDRWRNQMTAAFLNK